MGFLPNSPVLSAYSSRGLIGAVGPGDAIITLDYSG